MYTLLIFDWDGTIINSEERIISCMRSASQDLELPLPHPEAVRNIIGLGLPEAIRALIPGIADEMIPRMRERYAFHYIEGDQTPTPLFPGVEDTLARLRDRGFRMAVATGKNRPGLDRVFEQTGLGQYFELSRCADETTSKPDPHMLHEILSETQVPAHQALMIGDTEYDLEMGQRAGVPTAAVSYGAHPIHRLRPWCPVVELDHFTELELWLANHTQMLDKVD
ncbi:HAD family hydrolase [Nitrincola sp. MINF-07-Sa-05]|uniref:HAD family hydrolase n=1 Tax=Nitrincola salilacus TaxID=3400273 RepID=UPI0039182BF3